MTKRLDSTELMASENSIWGILTRHLPWLSILALISNEISLVLSHWNVAAGVAIALFRKWSPILL